jgi:hypothetical protein
VPALRALLNAAVVTGCTLILAEGRPRQARTVSMTGSMSYLPAMSTGWLGSSQKPWVPGSARGRKRISVSALDDSNLS